MCFRARALSSTCRHRGTKRPAALRLSHIYPAGAQSLKESLDNLGLKPIGGRRRERVNLVKCNEPVLVADFDGASDDRLQVHSVVLSEICTSINWKDGAVH